MINNCIFIGRLGNNPQVTTLENGTKVAQFSIACDEMGYTTKDGRTVDKRTEWIPVVLWRGLAEVAEKYLKKGNLVYISGKFRTRSFDKNGQTIYRSEIYVDNMKILESKRESTPLPPDVSSPSENSEATSNTTSPIPEQVIPNQEDDIPF